MRMVSRRSAGIGGGMFMMAEVYASFCLDAAHENGIIGGVQTTTMIPAAAYNAMAATTHVKVLTLQVKPYATPFFF
ncbi:MAG: hypothetical protein Fur0021_40580 [Candidatus Promineifilaceae bacterium]